MPVPTSPYGYRAPLPPLPAAPSPDGPVRFAVIGAGWRSEFFIRLAAMAPERLECTGVMVRRPEERERLAATWPVPAVGDIDALLATGPEVVIPAVSWPSMPHVIRELVERGQHVLAETPPAPDPEGLFSLWADVGDSDLVQVAEQYLLIPGHAARLAAVSAGLIGRPTLVEVASTHGYHAISLIRGLLGGSDGLVSGPVTVTARRLPTPMVDPLTPAGWVEQPTVGEQTTTLATLSFSDGRSGLYEFVSNQWWNPLISRRLLVRGTHGEIVDDRVTRWDDAEGPVTSRIEYRRNGVDLDLEGEGLVHASLDGTVLYRNPWVGSRMSEDDLAVATILEQTGAWARGAGPAPYPLAQACEDHLISCAIEEAADTGRDVTTVVGPWA